MEACVRHVNNDGYVKHDVNEANLKFFKVICGSETYVPRCPKMSQDLSRHHFLNPIPSWVLTSPFDCMACLGLSFPITGSSFPATRTAMDSTSSWCQLLKDLESGISHLQSLTMITNNNFEP